jgi:5S rRNA maturation endonuclease (ribonuclease M5)
MHDKLFNLHTTLQQAGCKPGPVQHEAFKASCPVPGHGKGNGDKNPSLSVKEAVDGRILINCHAGCSFESILDALGISNHDLSSPYQAHAAVSNQSASHVGHSQQGKNGKQIETVYPYFSAENVLLFEVVRYKPKSFRQRRPDPDKLGSYVWNLKTVVTVPYHLPEILEHRDQPVLIAEGEKDAETLNQLGYLATTAPMGAGKWKPSYSKWLAGRTVFILQDSDEPGAKHATDIANHLAGIAANVHIVDPFRGHADLTAWIDAGHTKADLESVLEDASQEQAPASEASVAATHVFKSGSALMKTEIPEPVWVVPSLLCEGLAILAGRPKSGKSWMALSIGIAVATGRRALGLADVVPGNVLVLSLEDSERRLQDRIRIIAGDTAEGDVLQRFDYLVGAPPPLSVVEQWLVQHPQARLIVIDTFGRFRDPQTKNSNLYEHDTRSADSLQRLALKHHICILLVHHTRKMEDANDPVAEISGSFGLSGVADTILVMKRLRGSDRSELFITGRDVDEARHHMKFETSNDPDHPNQHAGWIFASPTEDADSTPRAAVMEMLRAAKKPLRLQEIFTELGYADKSSLRFLLKRMIADGLLRQPKWGFYEPEAGQEGDETNEQHEQNSTGEDAEPEKPDTPF